MLFNPSIHGVGLGFRRDQLDELESHPLEQVDFFEIAPENWINMGGRFDKALRRFTERKPFTCHGLSLSIGSADPLDTDLLKSIKAFMHYHDIKLYTEHLSWCSFNGHMYDLLPIPFTEEAVHWVADRIRIAQDILEMPIGMENASYYFRPPESSLSEAEFINAILDEANCYLHLDVNNVYVNSQNLKYDAEAYIDQLNIEKTRYMHIAGHYVEPDGMIVDTHGADVIDPVWRLLAATYQKLSLRSDLPAEQIPICLERDFNFPALDELIAEMTKISDIRDNHIRNHRDGNAQSASLKRA